MKHATYGSGCRVLNTNLHASHTAAHRLNTAAGCGVYHFGIVWVRNFAHKLHCKVVEHHAQEQQHLIHREHVARTAVSPVSKRKKVEPR